MSLVSNSATVTFGRENVSVTVMDEAHPAAAALRHMASVASFDRLAGDHYPGIRAQVPDGYVDWLQTLLSREDGQLEVIRTSFAIATDGPEHLAPIQRIPHFDDTDPDLVAAVHYLCVLPHGGTSFYRHRDTGYERITPQRQVAWRQALVRFSQAGNIPMQGYAGENETGFERIGQVELRFNRLISYPANCLHSGDIGKGMLSNRPEEGRLTITSLLKIRP